MKIRTFYIILKLAIVISAVISYTSEYKHINKVVPNIDYTVRTAVDMSVQQVLMSDDFYLDSMNYGSNSSVLSDSSEVTSSKLWVHGTTDDKNMMSAVIDYNGGTKNYMQDKKKLANSLNESQAKNLGESFRLRAFNWQYNTEEFKRFYNWVRGTGKFVSQVYNYSNSSYSKEKVCTLDLMGTGEFIGGRQAYNTNKAISNEDVNSILKRGYYGNYMLTPTALGITYINKDMLLPLIQTNLEMVSAYSLSSDVNKDVRTENKHIGCMELYGNKHEVNNSEYIINNGYFEIDLNKINIDIEYKAVDLTSTDTKDKKILDLALGKLSENEVNKYGNKRTIKPNSGQYIVVARVKVDVGIHIPVNSPFIQNMYEINPNKLFAGKNKNFNPHLDINQVNNSGNFINQGNGVMYTYSFYTAVTP